MYGTTAKLKVLKVMECRIWKASQRLRALSHSVMSNPQRPQGLQPSRLLHPKMAGNRFERFLVNFHKLPKGKALGLTLGIVGLILLLIRCLSE